MTTRCIQAVVRGRVQGVGFRWFVRESARRLGLSGDVRNRPDGAVEVHAAGDADAVDALVDSLRQGPEGANVADVEVQDQELGSALPHPFSIVR